MAKRVLVDTNVIIAAHRLGLWTTLANRHDVETVRECVIETQTGHLNRKPHQTIDQLQLESSLAAPPHTPTLLQIARVELEGGGGLDSGEKHLWAHALDDAEAWLLSGPDGASVDFGVRMGFGDRLVSLEKLLGTRAEFRKRNVGENYTEAWLRQRVTRQVLAEMARSGRVGGGSPSSV